MDQVLEQSFDLQLFADEAGADTAVEPQETTETAEPETQGAESDTSDDTALDYSKLGQMSQDEQFAALKSAGVFGDVKPTDKPQEPPQRAARPCWPLGLPWPAVAPSGQAPLPPAARWPGG